MINYPQGEIIFFFIQDYILTLIRQGGGQMAPLSENRNFFRTEPPLDLRPVCKFKFVCCGLVEKTRALYQSWFSCGAKTKLENTLFDKIHNFSKKIPGEEF